MKTVLGGDANTACWL